MLTPSSSYFGKHCAFSVSHFPTKMLIRFRLESSLSRWLLVFCAGLGGGLLAAMSLMRFTVNVMADAAIGVPREVLEGATGYFPNAPDLHARLAAKLVEAKVEETQNHEQVAELAAYHARRAVSLAPFRYDNYVLLAVASEMRGDLAGAETALHKALSLAPGRDSLRWRLGNLFLREGKLAEAAAELRKAVAADAAYLPEALDLMWQATNGKIEALRELAGEVVKNKLLLAQFLAGQEQYEAAAEIYAGLDAQTAHDLPAQAAAGNAPNPGEILDKSLAADRVPLAAKLWQKLLDRDGAWGAGVVWNGGFETVAPAGLTQFDWALQSNQRVRIGVTSEVARGGRHSLQLAYLGKETTRLETEIRQLLVVQPGKTYQVECYAKTAALASPDGPQLAVLRAADRTVLALSPPIAQGSHDWQPLKAEFKAPANTGAVLLAIRQTPRFSYTDPTRGTVWFDDFRVTELPL